MFPVPSSPTIDHCLIANNQALAGGGIMIFGEDTEPVITNNTIIDNSADYYGGAIYIDELACPTIANNIIAHNSAYSSGGIENWSGAPSIINNTIVHNRPNGLYLGPTPSIFGADSAPMISNNIIWQNEIYVDSYVWPGDYEINFNNIQGGYEI